MDLSQKLKEKQANLYIIGLLALAACLLFQSIAPLLPRWLKWSQDLGHSLPTLIILIGFIWQVRPIKHARDSAPFFWLLCLLLGTTSFSWYLFQSINVEIASALLLIVALTLYLATSFSAVTAFQLLPLIGLLFFVVPIWAELNDALIAISSFAVGKLVDSVHLTAMIEGNTILIPSGRIVIADGCSGLRYLTISLLLGYIISLLNGYSLRQSIFALLIATTLGLLTNWIRIFLLVLIGYYTNMQSSLMHNHEMFGWILFAFILLPAIYWAPIIRKDITLHIKIPSCKPVIPTLFLLIGPALLFTANHTPPSSNLLTLNGLTTAATTTMPVGGIALEFPENTQVSTRYLTVSGIIVEVDLATFTPTSNTEKLVPYISSLFNKEEWLETTPPESNQGIENFSITTLKNLNSAQQAVLLQQFNVGNSVTGSYRIAKLLQLRAKLLGENFFGVLTIQTKCKNDCEEELAILKNIAQDWQQHKRNKQ